MEWDKKGEEIRVNDLLTCISMMFSFAKFIEDAVPLIENSTLRNRILRLNTDFQNYIRDEAILAKLTEMYQNSTNITSK